MLLPGTQEYSMVIIPEKDFAVSQKEHFKYVGHFTQNLLVYPYKIAGSVPDHHNKAGHTNFLFQ